MERKQVRITRRNVQDAAGAIWRMVDRCHVNDSFETVKEYVLSRFKPEVSWTPAADRLLDNIIGKRMVKNFALYTKIMTGRLNLHGD